MEESSPAMLASCEYQRHTVDRVLNHFEMATRSSLLVVWGASVSVVCSAVVRCGVVWWDSGSTCGSRLLCCTRKRPICLTPIPSLDRSCTAIPSHTLSLLRSCGSTVRCDPGHSPNALSGPQTVRNPDPLYENGEDRLTSTSCVGVLVELLSTRCCHLLAFSDPTSAFLLCFVAASAVAMADEHKLQSEEPTEHDTQDNHKQSPSDLTESTSASTATASPTAPSSSTSAALDPSSAIEQLLEKDAAKAEAAKAEGNAHFSSKQYEAAIESYTQAILLCPSPAPDAADYSAHSSLLATLHSNRAAAHLNLSHYPPTIADATQSIARQPTVKAHLRRSIAYEKEEKYTEACEDIRAAIAMGGLDGRGSGVREEEERLRRLEAAKKEKEEAMKTEMLGKLKELGNGLLGKFGMSLDNFKAVKDPSTGSYSISFGK